MTKRHDSEVCESTSWSSATSVALSVDLMKIWLVDLSHCRYNTVCPPLYHPHCSPYLFSFLSSTVHLFHQVIHMLYECFHFAMVSTVNTLCSPAAHTCKLKIHLPDMCSRMSVPIPVHEVTSWYQTWTMYNIFGEFSYKLTCSFHFNTVRSTSYFLKYL